MNSAEQINAASALNTTTAHSQTINKREEKHLKKEQAKETKRAAKQEKVADKLSAKADKEFAKAATKATKTGMFAERSALKHEEKAVELAAAANLHRAAASESHSEAMRAETLNSMPVRGTLPPAGGLSSMSAAPLMAAPLSSFSSTSSTLSSVPLTSAPTPMVIDQPLMGAPLAAAPLTTGLPLAAPVTGAAPITGRKAKKAQRLANKQQAIQQKLTTELNPPTGDPAVNHYRRGADATVPLAGTAIAGQAAPKGTRGTRRVGKRNNYGPRRGRLNANAPVLPVPATQPPISSTGIVAPVIAQGPSVVPLNANSAAFTPLAGVTHVPSFTHAATNQGIPLSSGPMLSAPMTSQGQFLEKQYVQPTVFNAQPSGSVFPSM